MKFIQSFFVALVLFLCGCASSMVRDAVDAADERIREKWTEEWKPNILNEIKFIMASAQDILMKEIDKDVEKKLSRVDLRLEDYDKNNDQRLQGTEALTLLKDIQNKNEDAPEPLSLLEIAILFAGIYGGGSAIKGGVRMAVNGKNNHA